jgi:hypothetical protein
MIQGTIKETKNLNPPCWTFAAVRKKSATVSESKTIYYFLIHGLGFYCKDLQYLFITRSAKLEINNKIKANEVILQLPSSRLRQV